MLTKRRKLPIVLRGTVIDVETTGLPNRNSELVTLGWVSGDVLQIIQKTVEEDFLEIALKRLEKCPRPYYAFNKAFEKHFLGIEIDNELQAYEYESKRKAIQIAGLPDPYDGKGVHVVEAWNKYCSTGDERHLKPIMLHNQACLLFETCLVLVGPRNPPR